MKMIYRETMVPTLDEMRAMSEADLLRLRTELAYDHSVIEAQLFDPNAHQIEPTPGWERKARSAQHIRAQGINTIKNIMAERAVQRKDQRVPLARWLSKLQEVVNAADAFVESDSDANWEALEASLKNYHGFLVAADIAEARHEERGAKK